MKASLDRLNAIKAEEKAIKKALKAKGIVIKGKRVFRLVEISRDGK